MKLTKGNNLMINGKIITVLGTLNDKVYYGNEESPCYNYVSEFEPIPLTEEILLKCPDIIFNHKSIINKNYTIYLGRDRYLSLNDIGLGNEIIALCSKNENSHDDVTIIHNRDFDGRMTLHKFQNLYFALTGEELPFKP